MNDRDAFRGRIRHPAKATDGHGAATTFDPCVLGAVAGYVIAGVLPAEGKVCVQQGEAFPATVN